MGYVHKCSDKARGGEDEEESQMPHKIPLFVHPLLFHSLCWLLFPSALLRDLSIETLSFVLPSRFLVDSTFTHTDPLSVLILSMCSVPVLSFVPRVNLHLSFSLSLSS